MATDTFGVKFVRGSVKLVFILCYIAFMWASIHHVATFFNDFEADSSNTFGSYMLAGAFDITALVTTMGVMFFRKSMPLWVLWIVWTFILAITGYSFFINWEYASHYQNMTLLMQPTGVTTPVYDTHGVLHYVPEMRINTSLIYINPVVASGFTFFALIYSVIAEFFGTKPPTTDELLAKKKYLEETNGVLEEIRNLEEVNRKPSFIERARQTVIEARSVVEEVRKGTSLDQSVNPSNELETVAEDGTETEVEEPDQWNKNGTQTEVATDDYFQKNGTPTSKKTEVPVDIFRNSDGSDDGTKTELKRNSGWNKNGSASGHFSEVETEVNVRSEWNKNGTQTEVDAEQKRNSNGTQDGTKTEVDFQKNGSENGTKTEVLTDIFWNKDGSDTDPEVEVVSVSTSVGRIPSNGTTGRFIRRKPMTVAEVATRLECTEKWVRSLRNTGALLPFEQDKKLIDPVSVKAYLATKK